MFLGFKIAMIAKWLYYTAFAAKSGAGAFKVAKWKWNWIKNMRKGKNK